MTGFRFYPWLGEYGAQGFATNHNREKWTASGRRMELLLTSTNQLESTYFSILYYITSIVRVSKTSVLKVLLKRNFRIWDFCVIIKFQSHLQTLPTFFSPTLLENYFFNRLKSAGWAQNWRPSWRGQNSLVTSRVVWTSMPRWKLEWKWENIPVV